MSMERLIREFPDSENRMRARSARDGIECAAIRRRATAWRWCAWRRPRTGSTSGAGDRAGTDGTSRPGRASGGSGSGAGWRLQRRQRISATEPPCTGDATSAGNAPRSAAQQLRKRTSPRQCPTARASAARRLSVATAASAAWLRAAASAARDHQQSGLSRAGLGLERRRSLESGTRILGRRLLGWVRDCGDVGVRLRLDRRCAKSDALLIPGCSRKSRRATATELPTHADELRSGRPRDHLWSARQPDLRLSKRLGRAWNVLGRSDGTHALLAVSPSPASTEKSPANAGLFSFRTAGLFCAASPSAFAIVKGGSLFLYPFFIPVGQNAAVLRPCPKRR